MAPSSRSDSATGPLPEAELDLAVTVSRTRARAVSPMRLRPNGCFPPARLRWEFWNGTGWTALKCLRTRRLLSRAPATLSSSCRPRGLRRRPSSCRRNPRPLLDPRAGGGEPVRAAPELLAIRTNTVAAEQAETIVDEIVGGSDGSRNQRFPLASKPVLKGSLQLEIQQSDIGYEIWQEVDDFFGSGPRDNHYVLDRTTGEILIGDGSTATSRSPM